MSARPEYKSHPLWAAAMDLARDAYALAEGLRTDDAEACRRLRRAAVRVPARIAGALSTNAEGRTEHVLAARGACGEAVTTFERAIEAVPESRASSKTEIATELQKTRETCRTSHS